jgi:pyruvate/2-oxoglutarate/acetoin dehydrogenase E1 component
MEWLGQQENTLFIGQAVEFAGTGMYNTLPKVPAHKKKEFPVAEETQMGVSTGLALQGFTVISIYPRWNFLLLAINQLVNHLDKLPAMSKGGYNPKVIIRTAIGSERPLHPQHQHVGDFTEAVCSMCQTIKFVKLEESSQIFPAYRSAYESNCSTVLVEYGDYYNEK